MRRSLRAPAVIVAGALAALATYAAPARAASSDGVLSTHDLQVMPIAAGNQPNGDSRVSITLDPGASAQRSFMITNRTSGLRLTVRLAAVDAASASDGQVKFASDASAAGPAGWLSLSDVVATLEPKAALRVTLTIAPPGNVDPGRVYAGVVARVDHSVRMADGAAGPKGEPISLPVEVDVKGAATALVSVVGVNAVKHGNRTYLEVAFQNGGATANTMSGTLKVLGAHPQSFDLHANVAPLAHTVERIAFAMPSGAKTVSVSVDTQDASGNQAAWSGAVGFDSVPASAPAAPSSGAHSTKHAAASAASHPALMSRALLGLVALAFALAAIWFGAELRRSRRRARAVSDEQPVRRLRRMRRSVPIPIPVTAPAAAMTVDAPEPRERDAPAPAFVETDAIAARLGELVRAIDRLVSRLGEVAPAPGTPNPVPGAPEPADHEITARVESGAILYAAAAPPPEPPAFDPYDWPTEQQLDEFIARRKTGRTDPSQ